MGYKESFMAHKGPHISISQDFVVNRILRINLEAFENWPESVRELAISIAEELFLIAYNPFIQPESVRASVNERFTRESQALAQQYVTTISEGITIFWSAYEAERRFRQELVERLKAVMPEDCVLTRPGSLVECATDATDLRMELPLLVVEPATTEQVSALVRLANDMKFAVIPRGGGSGMTGGAVPMLKRSVVVNMTRLTSMSVDREHLALTCQAGVITQDAIDRSAREGLLFTVDPASKTASTIGGNVAENSGGPFAFEYGTTLDNLLSWRMVTPTGEIIDVQRIDHPRHKILPEETAVFEVRDPSGGMRSVVELKGDEIRLPGLGKDVTNKALGGLPGMQKEGVDGIITEATFTLHEKPVFSRVMVLEVFGKSMRPAAEIIQEIVALRDRIRNEGDYARLSALEEFNVKYVQAIGYQRKSIRHAGDPISVIIVQVDGNDEYLLDQCVNEIVALVGDNEYVAVTVAKDEKEGELFWEDRHKLSAIARRTSGFKINEDVVIPMRAIPDFAHFLEALNLEMSAAAYRYALQEVGRLPGFPLEDREVNREFTFASRLALGEEPKTPRTAPVPENGSHAARPGISDSAEELTDEDVLHRAEAFLKTLEERYPRLAKKIEKIAEYMRASRIVIASHMHAGDGNCHVNIPVNSNDPHMMEQAEEAAMQVMARAQEMGGAVSGEHGIGITKISFLGREKMDALREFKKRVDPRDILNPGKLVQRELPVRPFTFSFNRLIEDIRQSGLQDKERFIKLLTTVQTCTRCGKCKQVCSMCYPERSMQYHPRNKNMVLGMLLEAVYYSQVNKGAIDDNLLRWLRDLVEHCTACGRCLANCPVKIPSGEVALTLRSLLEHENAGGHPIKKRALEWLVHDVSSRVPKAAKMASLGQKVQNKLLGVVPSVWKKRMQSPIFAGSGPKMGYTNLYESLRLHRGSVFAPREVTPGMPCVLYFPGCGGSLFYDRIGLAAIMLLLHTGHAVAVPPRHLCCGYPLLAAGMDTEYEDNMAQNRQYLASMLRNLIKQGFDVRYLATACGSCRDSLARMKLNEQFPQLEQKDVSQIVLPLLQHEGMEAPVAPGTNVLYHAACHCEWAGVPTLKGQAQLTGALEQLCKVKVSTIPGCCGESGMGAVTSPTIYNLLRARKKERLAQAFEPQPQTGACYAGPILVGCPSCKIGIARCLIQLKEKHPVLHVLEWLANQVDGEDRRQRFRRRANETRGDVRIVQC